MRREHDFYPTPANATRELLKRINIVSPVLEPCVGRGDMADVLRTDPRVGLVFTNDLDRTHLADWHDDATWEGFWRTLPPIEYVVTNPPFSKADQILPLAWKYARVGVAMLLRISYLEPCEGRGAWLAEHPPSKLIVLPRISFTGDGDTDMATCAWFVWDRACCGQSIEIVNPVDERQPSLLDDSLSARVGA